ncbi:CoA-binding protein, partial [Burkholderia gladioli]|uniref:CoA-binding protein n=1 Tax=Burkholderia gladioli TaxID=28095 RepID=UPI003FED62D9
MRIAAAPGSPHPRSRTVSPSLPKNLTFASASPARRQARRAAGRPARPRSGSQGAAPAGVRAIGRPPAFPYATAHRRVIRGMPWGDAVTVRNLDALFRPKSVAVVGASRRAGSIGAIVWGRVLDGGFAGPAWPVNPKYDELNGQRVFARVSQLPEAPSLA